MFDAPATKPQSVGDLIGRAFRAYRGNIPVFVHALLWPTIISLVGKVAIQWGVSQLADKSLSPFFLAGIGTMMLGTIVSFVALFFLTLRQLAFVRMANGFASAFGEAYAFVKGRIASLIGLIVLGHVLLFGSFCVCGIVIAIAIIMMKAGSPGLLIGSVIVLFSVLAVMAIGVLYYLVGFVCLALVTCENCSITGAINRGFKLTFNDLGRSILFSLVLLITISALSYPLSLPAVMLPLFEFFRHGMAAETLTNPAKMPLYVLVLTQAWESVVNMLLWPVIFLAYGMFYYDLRVRQEGIDVSQKLLLIERHAD